MAVIICRLAGISHCNESWWIRFVCCEGLLFKCSYSELGIFLKGINLTKVLTVIMVNSVRNLLRLDERE